MEQHAINWFEIGVSDFDRARKFYSAIFDYEMPTLELGGTRMGFFPHTRPNGMGSNVGGAICASSWHTPNSKGTVVYLNGGNDLSIVLNRIESAGGKVMIPKTQITPELGYMAFFTDTEGNTVALHSPQ